MYWVQTVPYLVDVSNSVIVSFSWIILGNNTLDKHMSTFWFGILTFVIILAFILVENAIKNSLELLSLIGGGAMFIMSMLFVLLAVWSVMHGHHIATQPFNLAAFKPSFSLRFFLQIPVRSPSLWCHSPLPDRSGIPLRIPVQKRPWSYFHI